jgi:hypothetical protein
MRQKSFTPERDYQRKISKPSQPFLVALKASPAFPTSSCSPALGNLAIHEQIQEQQTTARTVFEGVGVKS